MRRQGEGTHQGASQAVLPRTKGQEGSTQGGSQREGNQPVSPHLLVACIHSHLHLLELIALPVRVVPEPCPSIPTPPPRADCGVTSGSPCHKDDPSPHV